MTPITQAGYSPWVSTAPDGSQQLVQIFTDLDTGLIVDVLTASRPDRWSTWGSPTRYERA